MYKKIRGLCILMGMVLLGSHTTAEAQESRMQQGIVEEAATYNSEPDALAESEVIASGTLFRTETITYTLTADGVLTLSGEGKLSDYNWELPYLDDIVHVIIEDGITDIGYTTFKGAPKLVSVTMADSITEIGNTAFSGCHKLETVKPSNSLLSYQFPCSISAVV